MALSEKFFSLVLEGRYRCGNILAVQKSPQSRKFHADNFGLNLLNVTRWHRPVEDSSDLGG